MSEDDLYRALGRAIADRRRDRGLSQAAVARAIGLTRASLANLEGGRQRVLLHHLYRLVPTLGLTSLFDLIPAQWTFEDVTPPPRFAGSPLSAQEEDMVEKLIQSIRKPAGKGRR
jgi:transcriptional regulator with XRE-family HTH domain